MVVPKMSESDKIVISGISGVFPESRNVYEFLNNLYNKVDMITEKNNRWDVDHPEIPKRSGKIQDIEKFDNGYFGIPNRQVHTMCPLVRILLERSVEAIFDAGMHPSELKGTKTGVFVGSSFSEVEAATLIFMKVPPKSGGITGSTRSMIAHRISYHLKLDGPAMNCDTACSSSLVALVMAFQALRNGTCDQAIVAGVNLNLHPASTSQFAALGVLSKDGICKIFDDTGNGYVRSEAAGVIFIQKLKNAKRNYGEVVMAKGNCDGFTSESINYPSRWIQADLLRQCYEACDVTPEDLSYFEAHGTGTFVGDPEEAGAIEMAILSQRSKPLLVGSVKSNVGHSEPSSGMTSLIKALMVMEYKIIPPNIHYNTPRRGIKSLETGQLKVVTENTKLDDPQITIGVSSFGFGGSNGHAILRSCSKDKINKGIPDDDLPRLVCVSGRTQESVNAILNDLKGRQLDAEYVRLFHEIFRKNIDEHRHRGYSILSKNGEINRSMRTCSDNKKKLCIVFGDSHLEWLSKAKDLLSILPFKITIEMLHDKLLKYNINLLKVLQTEAKSEKDKIFATVAVQIAFIHVFKSLMIKPDYYIGIGVGEFLCGYLDDCLSLEEVLRSVHQVTFSNDKITSQNGGLIMNGHSNKSDTLVDNLQKIISNPKCRSHRWLSNYQLKSANAEYFSQSLSSSKHRSNPVPSGSILVVIGETPNRDFQQGNFEIFNFNSTKEDIAITFLETLGSLYNFGVDMEIDKLYPEIEFPVSRTTPMISPLIKWYHEQDFPVELYKPKGDSITYGATIEVDINQDKWSFLTGHMIEERNLFPATGYLYLVLSTLATNSGRVISDMNVVFENCKFIRATTLSSEKITKFFVSIQVGTGDFEILEGETVVVTGHVSLSDDLSKEFCQPLQSDQLNSELNCVKLDSKDVYKELRLRGYNYKGAFRQVKEVSLDLSHALVKWSNNWIAFMDNLLQTKILHLDSRELYVPIGIDRLVIDTSKHIGYAKLFEDEAPNLPVTICNTSGIIRSGGIEIRGLKASPIAKKKILEEPVLEKYLFIPNEADLQLEEAIRVNVEIALENVPALKYKVVELVEDNLDENDLLGPIINKMLLDQPAIQPDLTLLSLGKLNVEGVNVANKRLSTETDCHIVAGSNMLQRQSIMIEALGALKDGGFIMSREPGNFDHTKIQSNQIEIFTTYVVGNDKLVFVQKHRQADSNAPISIQISNTRELSWVKELQEAISSKKNIILYSQNEPQNGIMGLVNCIRREPGKDNIKCVFITGDAPPFNPKHPFYENQLKKNMAINVFKDSKWGTYRHLLLDKLDEVTVEHSFVNNLVRGDLSSLKWIEGPITTGKSNKDDYITYIYYAALNFKDVMVASGRIFHVLGQRINGDCDLGYEYTGRTSSGERVMGVCRYGALSTLTNIKGLLEFKVPDKWSLEEAATVPCVYATVLYGISMRSNLRKGHSILIHSGAGGIGIAAINLALFRGCQVYTTVGTKEKREFLKETFPQLKDEHIFNSRDTSFEEAIYKATNGRGVDFVLNSLAEEKLFASVRCLARGGTFLEIGKYDILNNARLKLMLFEKQASFHGIMLDILLDGSNSVKNQLIGLVNEGINDGSIRPLPRKVFKVDEIEEAFRYMTTGKHIGKNVIQIREEEKDVNALPKAILYKAVPRYNCNVNDVYIITGGLGGFGLELADWLIVRGARKLVLTSRKGVTTGYQALRLKLWQSYGVTVKISTADITTKSGCEELIKESKSLGPIGALFNLAVVLQDAIFENQSEDSFKTSFGPKAWATEYLDELTRKHCPELRDFVVFSSVSCGRGNAGQTNYGMSNSVMERICEQRRLDGYPGLAIEWGAIGDVGIVADMQEEHLTEMEIGGTLQQRITSCLQVLDVFLKQQNPVVSSIVVVKKKDGAGQGGSLVDVIAKILGIKDLKTVSQHSKLSELGMDSMTGVEIQQTLERDYQIVLTAQEIRQMTFANLQDLQDQLEDNVEKSSGSTKSLLDVVTKFVTDEKTALLQVLPLPNKSDKISKDTSLIFFPGIEGTAKVLETLSRKLPIASIALQFTPEATKNSVEETAEYILPIVEKLLSKSKPFRIVAYSYGILPALEVVSRLEKKGYSGKIICIDGAPEVAVQSFRNIERKEQEQFEAKMLLQIATFFIPQDIVLSNAGKIMEHDGIDKTLDIIRDLVPDNSQYCKNFVRGTVGAVYRRFMMIKDYKPSYKVKSKVTLYKPTEPMLPGMVEDYALSEICTDSVDVKIFNGNHVSVLDNVELANSILEWL